MPKLLTLAELGRELGVSPRTVRYYLKTYNVPYCRVPSGTSALTLAADPGHLYPVLLQHPPRSHKRHASL